MNQLHTAHTKIGSAIEATTKLIDTLNQKTAENTPTRKASASRPNTPRSSRKSVRSGGGDTGPAAITLPPVAKKQLFDFLNYFDYVLAFILNPDENPVPSLLEFIFVGVSIIAISGLLFHANYNIRTTLIPYLKEQIIVLRSYAIMHAATKYEERVKAHNLRSAKRVEARKKEEEKKAEESKVVQSWTQTTQTVVSKIGGMLKVLWKADIKEVGDAVTDTAGALAQTAFKNMRDMLLDSNDPYSMFFLTGLWTSYLTAVKFPYLQADITLDRVLVATAVKMLFILFYWVKTFIRGQILGIDKEAFYQWIPDRILQAYYDLIFSKLQGDKIKNAATTALIASQVEQELASAEKESEDEEDEDEDKKSNKPETPQLKKLEKRDQKEKKEIRTLQQVLLNIAELFKQYELIKDNKLTSTQLNEFANISIQEVYKRIGNIMLDFQKHVIQIEIPHRKAEAYTIQELRSPFNALTAGHNQDEEILHWWILASYYIAVFRQSQLDCVTWIANVAHQQAVLDISKIKKWASQRTVRNFMYRERMNEDHILGRWDKSFSVLKTIQQQIIKSIIEPYAQWKTDVSKDPEQYNLVPNLVQAFNGADRLKLSLPLPVFPTSLDIKNNDSKQDEKDEKKHEHEEIPMDDDNSLQFWTPIMECISLPFMESTQEYQEQIHEFNMVVLKLPSEMKDSFKVLTSRLTDQERQQAIEAEAKQQAEAKEREGRERKDNRQGKKGGDNPKVKSNPLTEKLIHYAQKLKVIEQNLLKKRQAYGITSTAIFHKHAINDAIARSMCKIINILGATKAAFEKGLTELVDKRCDSLSTCFSSFQRIHSRNTAIRQKYIGYLKPLLCGLYSDYDSLLKASHTFFDEREQQVIQDQWKILNNFYTLPPRGDCKSIPLKQVSSCKMKSEKYAYQEISRITVPSQEEELHLLDDDDIDVARMMNGDGGDGDNGDNDDNDDNDDEDDEEDDEDEEDENQASREDYLEEDIDDE